jgi:NADH dehydrogenase FAD-containing subunit
MLIIITHRGFIKVNSHLQLSHHPNIFVCGDVIAVDEEKLAQTAEKHAAVVTRNIRLLEAAQREDSAIAPTSGKEKQDDPKRSGKDIEAIGKKNAKRPLDLAVYDPTDLPIIVSLGKYAGALTWRGWALTGFLPAVMKEFVEWKVMVRARSSSLLASPPNAKAHHHRWHTSTSKHALMFGPKAACMAPSRMNA